MQVKITWQTGELLAAAEGKLVTAGWYGSATAGGIIPRDYPGGDLTIKRVKRSLPHGDNVPSDEDHVQRAT